MLLENPRGNHETQTAFLVSFDNGIFQIAYFDLQQTFEYGSFPVMKKNMEEYT